MRRQPFTRLLAQPKLPFGEFANEIRGVIKRSDRDARRYTGGRGGGDERGPGKGLRTYGKRPVVSVPLKSDYDVR